MYICVCQAITEGKVKVAAEETGGCTRSTYKALSFRPKCGKCVQSIHSIVKDVSGAAESSHALEAK